MSKRQAVWFRMPSGNLVMENDELRVSYMSSERMETALDDAPSEVIIAQRIGGILHGEDEPQDETALYDHKVWRILKGDFRAEYEKAFPDLQKCIAVYEKHKGKDRSEWSTDL